MTELPSIDAQTALGLWIVQQKGKSMAAEKKTLKFQMMMSPAEAEALDEWMFANRIRSRAEAIRRLCQVGLLLDRKENDISRLRHQLMTGANALMATVSDDLDGGRSDIVERYMGPTAEVVASTAFLQMQVGLVFEYLRHIKLGETYDDADAAAKRHMNVVEDALADMKTGKRVKLDVDGHGNVVRTNSTDDDQ